MWTIIAAVLAVVITFYYYYHQYNFFKKHEIPYAKPFLFLGSLWKAVLSLDTFVHSVQEAYNVDRNAKYVGLFDFLTPVVMIRDLDLIKSVTVKHFDQFVNHRTLQSDVGDSLFSKNLFNLRDDKWREIRAVLSPAFTSSKMKSMFVLMKECGKKYGKYLASLPADQKTLELKDTFTRYTNDVIATCAFGVTVNSMENKDNKFYVYGREATNFGWTQTIKFFLMRSLPTLAKLLNIKLVRSEISDFFHDLVASAIKAKDEQGIVRPDMLQLMMDTRGKMEPGKELTIEDMTAQAFIFFFGGFESTSTVMCFAAYELGVNQDAQRRLQEEIDQVMEDYNGEPTYEAINGMKYLDAVVNETLRLYPIGTFADRLCAKDFELPPALPHLKPYRVKKGEVIWVPICGIHYDPEFYPEPEKFNPDRFYDDPKKIINSGAYLSFGLGPRMCIGNRFALLETKVLVFYLFANCNLVPCSKTVIPMQLSKKGFTLTAEGGFWIDVQPRKKPQVVLVNGSTSSSVAC